jgi:hypothetical protein
MINNLTITILTCPTLTVVRTRNTTCNGATSKGRAVTLIDSGASRIMSSRRDWFHSYTLLMNPIKVALGDDSTIPAIGIGHLFVCMHTGSQWSHAVLQDILHVPNLHSNLLSVSHFNHCGHEIHFTDNGCQLLDKSKNLVCVGHL